MSCFNIVIAVLSLLALQTLAAAAAQLSLTANPSVVMVGLTDTLTMRCSLLDATLSEAFESSTVSNTSMDINHARSIIVYRGETERETLIARIIGSYPAEAIADKENLQAEGVLSPNVSTGPNYLEMVWTEPGKEQSGQYTCRSHGLDSLGRGIVLQVKADIKVEEPDIPELITAIRNLKNQDDTQEKTINEMKNQAGTQEKTINEVKNQAGTQEKTINEMKLALRTETDKLENQMDAQEKTISDMRRILKAPHAEQGEVRCYSKEWRDLGNNFREIDKYVRFNKPYTGIPVVGAGIVRADIGEDYNARYYIRVSDVTTTGFKLTCGTWHDSVIYELGARWISTVA